MATLDISEQIIERLGAYGIKQAPGGNPNKYMCNSPFRAGSDSMAFAVEVDENWGSGGMWKDHVSGKGGNFVTLGKHFGIETGRADAVQTKKVYQNGAEYSQAHGVAWEVFTAADWSEGEVNKRPCVFIETQTGRRARFLDGNKPTYKSPEGYRHSWYLLDSAIEIAKRTGQRLVLCNGEASTVVAQHFGVAAFCMAGGSESPRKIALSLVDELQTKAKDHKLFITLDCDAAGKESAAHWLAAFNQWQLSALTVDLNGGKGFDLADFCRLQPDGDAAHALTFLKVPLVADVPSAAASVPSVPLAPVLTDGDSYTDPTGALRIMPTGYSFKNGCVNKVKYVEGGVEYAPLYKGQLSVVGLRSDIESADNHWTVIFTNWSGKLQTITEPVSSFTTKPGILSLGNRGLRVSDTTASNITAYLGAYVEANADELPVADQVNHFGIVKCDDGYGLVTPLMAIGFGDRDISYHGQHAFHYGKNNVDAYRMAIKEALTWKDVAPLWLTLAMSAASPIFMRYFLEGKIQRSAVVSLFGETTSGKTTVTKFAAGLWGNCKAPPFGLTENSTNVAMIDCFRQLHGLPFLIDDTHKHPNIQKLQSTVYDFANGQERAKGRKEGGMTGGAAIGGTLFLLGEWALKTTAQGASSRILQASIDIWPPLGAAPKSELGLQRATTLENALRSGMGTLGPKVAEHIWANQEAFETACKNIEKYADLQCDPSWKDRLIIAAATLSMLLLILNVSDKETISSFVIDQVRVWASMLSDGMEQHNPADEAWQHLAGVFGIARREERHNPDDSVAWVLLMVGNELFAACKPEDDYWRIPSTSKVLVERVGADVVSQFGKVWARDGRIEADKDGKPTRNLRLMNGTQTRCISVRKDALGGGDEPATMPALARDEAGRIKELAR